MFERIRHFNILLAVAEGESQSQNECIGDDIKDYE